LQENPPSVQVALAGSCTQPLLVLQYPVLQVNVELLPPSQLALSGHTVQPLLPLLFEEP
jgi:hypothetical protein